jgi:hypothetical protein
MAIPTLGQDASPTLDAVMSDRERQPRAHADAEFIKTGHHLYAFLLTKITALRHVRDGRQSLSRFARMHPLPNGTQLPPE